MDGSAAIFCYGCCGLCQSCDLRPNVVDVDVPSAVKLAPPDLVGNGVDLALGLLKEGDSL